MSRFSRDELLQYAGNSVYKLVVLSTRRALEIAEGAPKLVDADPYEKPTTVALREISQGKVKILVKK